jgi:response regulator RpfG family c-di-GMP phosphodiesterase
MTRPCFIVLDREHSGTISMRKLVIESDKLNVITAFSGAEALETFERFPAVNGVILNAVIPDMPCAEIVSSIRSRAPKLPIMVVKGPGAPECPGADHNIDSFDPVPLLELLRQLFPRAHEVIKRQDNALHIQEDLKRDPPAN